jgi:hypothetical protein
MGKKKCQGLNIQKMNQVNSVVILPHINIKPEIYEKTRACPGRRIFSGHRL